jgi:RNA polymerase sigma factor (sigma-70 family)
MFLPPDSTFEGCLHAAKAGDRSAQGRLLEALGSALKQSVNVPQGLRAKLDPEDLLQDGLLVVLRDLRKFQGGNRQVFLRWVKRIVEHVRSNAIKSWLVTKRDIRREILVPIDDAVGDEVDPAQFVQDNEETGVVRRRFQAMQLHDHAILVWLLAGYSLVEIAEPFGMSRGAVYQRIVRALPRLHAARDAWTSRSFPDSSRPPGSGTRLFGRGRGPRGSAPTTHACFSGEVAAGDPTSPN